MPCVRPIVGVCLNSMARRFSTSSSASMPLRMMLRSFFHLQSLRGVDHIVRREPVVQPARLAVQALVFEGLRHCRGEGDDVVLHLRLDLVDARRPRSSPCLKSRQTRRQESRRLQRGPRWQPTPPAASSDTCSLRSRCGPSRAGYNDRSRQRSWSYERISSPSTARACSIR